MLDHATEALGDLHMVVLGLFRFEIAATADGVAAVLGIDLGLAEVLIADLVREELLSAAVPH